MQRTSTNESEHWECSDAAPVTIVVGASGSEASLRALVYAIGAARRAGGRVIVVFSRKPCATWVFAGGGSVGGAECVLDDSAVAIVGGLAKLIATIERDADTPIELTHVVGDPARELAKFATDVRADLVVVGASRHRITRSWGSVGRQLNRNPTCPVTVVP